MIQSEMKAKELFYSSALLLIFDSHIALKRFKGAAK